MTLITAEEFHEKMLELLTDWDHHHQGSSRNAELDIIRDIQRNVAEAAAAVICPGCADGPPRAWDRWANDGFGVWCHKVDDAGIGTECPAVEIWRLVGECPAPEVKP